MTAKKPRKTTATKKPSIANAAQEVPPSVELTKDPALDLDDLDEPEEMASEAAARNSSGNAAALAAAAAGASTEMSASFKNFRHHPDMENFYRFIYENDLRHEALAILDQMMTEKQQRKLVKQVKGQSH